MLALGLLVALALGLRIWVIEPVRVLTSSMAPTLLAGDVVLVLKTSRPAPGAIVSFLEPGDAARRHLKRVVATEGQEVELSQGQLYVNGVSVAVDGIRETVDWQDSDCGDHRTTGAVERLGRATWRVLEGGSHPRERVAPGGVWLLGDNRGASSDSRHWGPVAESSLRGVVQAIVWSRDPCGGPRVDRIGPVAAALGGPVDQPAR